MNLQHKPSDFRLQQASGEILFRFDDLSIEVEDSGFYAGSFNGVARVTYWREADGLEIHVGDIILNCSKWNGESHDPQDIKLDRESRLYLAIWSELDEGSWKDFVDAAVREKL